MSQSGPSERPPRNGLSLDYATLRSRLDELQRKQLFFVGGLAKSGTTWVQLLLDGHPQVSCSSECHLANQLYPALKGALEEHNRFLLQKQEAVFVELGRGAPLFDEAELELLFATAVQLLLAKHAADKPVLAVGEKTPENAQVFGRFIRLFPAAKCIHVVRDPRDAAVSAWFHVLRTIPEETRKHFPSASDYFRYYVDQWVSQIFLGMEFGSRNPQRYLEVTYEAMSADPEPTLTGLLRFLGVDDGIAVVRKCLADAAFDRLSGGRARGRENRASLFRKGVTGDWKGHFDEPTRRYVIEKAGPLMRRFGFT